MRRYVFLILVMALAVYITGCGKKQAVLEEIGEPLSMDELSATTTDIPAPAEPVSLTQVPPLPPAGSYKPTAKEVQTALKNAGFYAGAIDGKIGPMTKKATEEFQKANNLQVDGKVGPKTWGALSRYLSGTQVDLKSR